MDVAKEDSQWKGEVKQTLKEIQRKVDEFSARLDKHLNDEEEKIDLLREEISNLRNKG
jgi:hypothetical protein